MTISCYFNVIDRSGWLDDAKLDCQDTKYQIFLKGPPDFVIFWPKIEANCKSTGNQLESTGINWNDLESTEINLNQLKSTEINWNQLKSIGIDWLLTAINWNQLESTVCNCCCCFVVVCALVVVVVYAVVVGSKGETNGLQAMLSVY